jgi:hypothetical protein
MRRPRFSPDGRHLAFECGDGGYDYGFLPQDVCVILDVPADVASMSGIGNGTGSTSPTPSAIRSAGPGRSRGTRRTANQLAVVRDPQWVVGGPFTSEIWLVNADGTGAQSLTGPITWNDGPLRIVSMDWAPGAGSSRSRRSTAQFERAIYRVEVANGSITQLTSAAAAVDDWRPVVSPDDSEILFARAGDGYSLYRIPSGTPNAEVRVTPCSIWTHPEAGGTGHPTVRDRPRDELPGGRDLDRRRHDRHDAARDDPGHLHRQPQDRRPETRGTGAYVEDRQPSWRP